MFILLQSKGTFLHRTASFDVLSAKIGLTDLPVGELKNQKSVVNFEQEVCIFYLYGEQKPLDRLSPNFFGGRGPRLNHAIQIWWRSVQGFLVGWGSKFAFFHRLWRSSLQHSHYRVRCDENWQVFLYLLFAVLLANLIVNLWVKSNNVMQKNHVTIWLMVGDFL